MLDIDSVLQALLALGWQSTESDVAKAAPATVLPALVEFVELDPHLKVRANAIVGRADTAAPDEILALVSDLEREGISAAGTSALYDFQPIEQIQTSLAEIALSSPPTAEARGVGAAALAGWFLAMGYRGEGPAPRCRLSRLSPTWRRGASLLPMRSTALRTGPTRGRPQSCRNGGRDSSPARLGVGALTIGAYGVVENLRPAVGPGLDGWIHAPSTRHAMAAGMLRSSHLSHLPDAGTDGGPFAIDLSSRRMQRAAHVIEGVRQGQTLGALVGYQIERALAEAHLARLQLSLRTIAPLVSRRLHDADGADSNGRAGGDRGGERRRTGTLSASGATSARRPDAQGEARSSSGECLPRARRLGATHRGRVECGHGHHARRRGHD